jgi:glutamate N-acetyltransferase/amino-acid N-acetyltransferase
LAAVGTTKATFDPYNIDVSINGIRVSSKGQPDQSRDLVDLKPRKVEIEIALNSGLHSATIFTNDLTHEYVEENSAYSS